MAITKRLIKGSPLTAAEMDANLDILESTSGSFTAFMTGSFLAVSSSVSNLSTLQGTLSGQFTGSAIISGSNASLIISGSTKIASASLSYANSDKVIVFDGTTGNIGWNTVNGVGTSGTSGVNGTNGLNGTFFGTNGVDGTSGINGTSGVDGTSGTSGTNGTTGTAGTSGVSGTNGTAGTSGVSGTNGTAGSGGSSGTSGTSADSNITNRLMQTTSSLNVTTSSLNTFTGSIRGEINGLEAYTASLKAATIISSSAQITALGFSSGGGGIFAQTGSFYATTNNIQITGSLSASLRSGYMWVGGAGDVSRLVATSSLTAGALTLDGFTLNGVVTFNAPSSTVNSNLLFDGSLLTVKGRVSASNSITASLSEGYALVGGAGNVSTLVATSSFGAGIFTQIGASNTYGTQNNVQITGSFSASLASGYTWVGGANDITRLVPTSSFGASLSVRNYNGSSFGAFNVQNVTTLAFSGSAVSVADLGSGVTRVEVTAAAGSGTSGTSGVNGLAGNDGSSGTGGTSGTSGVNGFGGTNGTSGTSGTSGSSGVSGVNGSDGTAGSSGVSGTSGVDGDTGSSGTSGLDGTSGTSGLTGGGGTAGTSGTSGVSGTDGFLTLNGTTNNGVITYNGVTTEGEVEADLSFNASTKLLIVSGSADIYTAMTIKRTFATPASPETGMLYVSASGAGGALMFYNGGSWIQLAAGL